MAHLLKLLALLEHAPAVVVQVVQAEGSVPRSVGTWMAVFAQELVGTIGGGHLEFDAIAQARQMLADPASAALQTQRFALGPSLGQCCGGVVHLQFERVSGSDTEALRASFAPAHAMPVALFGGGHVGKAIVQVLGALPVQVRWIDSRDEIFPSTLPENTQTEHSDPVQHAVRDLAPGSHVLIMSFSHAEDLDIVAACLQRKRQADDVPFIGLIGSQTKWATFKRRLRERGFSDAELAAVTCPIGLPSIGGKEPEVIAVAVAAQLLALRPAAAN
ncbi:MAG: xanthine dehydrogenase accessory protein XdhC [Burkholderiaceae bacterium]